MTKQRILTTLFILMLLAIAAWFISSRRPTRELPSQPGTSDSSAVPKLNGRRVLNLPPGKEKEAMEHLKITNIVSDDWKEGVEKALRVQGGDALKAVEINKLESLIWTQHGLAINAESVHISLTNEKGERTSFRAMVDSQSGKIIQTWDQPVIDPANPRENFRVKIDPRYFND